MIKLIVVGKIKEKYLKDAISEYEKRLSKYTKLKIIEIPDCKIDEEKIALKKEKESILKNIGEKDFVITTEIKAKQLTSEEFSEKLEEIKIINSNITFIIGGSHGMALEIKQRSNFSISFSKMTFPHQLFRVFLLEQIYRSFKISKNESYHK